MSLRLEMLQVARLAPKLLGESSELIRGFLLRQQNSDGGFKDRSGQSDLYYSVFGLDALIALQVDPTADEFENFLRTFNEGAGLDFVHLCCLARGWAGVAHTRPEKNRLDVRRPVLDRIESFRSADGGYHVIPGSRFGTVYGCFLALGAYQDLKGELPDALRVVQCLKFLETEDGAWANERNIRNGSTNATAAAVTLLRNLQMPVNPSAAEWLLARCHAEGGFLAMPKAPLPDLLSTATALHALAGMQIPLDPIKERCLDFIDTLWTNEGSFHGHWGEEVLDCEYTFYGLLALGHLSL